MAVLVMLLLLFPVLSGVTPELIQSGNQGVLWFPPYWFLGLYQSLVDGPGVSQERYFRSCRLIEIGGPG